mmetsp:Transcript_53069/g.161221  ORF Transcript_53069/g.161221 Transcript_53069/m.161221 type:complete len:211 (-) Transcript_53069:281-913(-)
MINSLPSTSTSDNNTAGAGSGKTRGLVFTNCSRDSFAARRSVSCPIFTATSTRMIPGSDKFVVTWTRLFGTTTILLSSVRTVVSNSPISATFPNTSGISIRSPTSYRRKISSMTPAARSPSNPCRAKPMATVHAENTAMKDVVEMPTIEATVMSNMTLRPLLAELTTNFIKVGSTRLFSPASSFGSGSSDSSDSSSLLPALAKERRVGRR